MSGRDWVCSSGWEVGEEVCCYVIRHLLESWDLGKRTRYIVLFFKHAPSQVKFLFFSFSFLGLFGFSEYQPHRPYHCEIKQVILNTHRANWGVFFPFFFLRLTNDHHPHRRGINPRPHNLDVESRNGLPHAPYHKAFSYDPWARTSHGLRRRRCRIHCPCRVRGDHCGG